MNAAYRVIDIDGITAGDTISVQASLSDEKGFFNSLLSCQVSTAVEIDVVTPIARVQFFLVQTCRCNFFNPYEFLLEAKLK